MAFTTYVGETKNKKGNDYMKFSFLTIETFLLFLGFFLGCAEIISRDETPPSVISINISDGEEITPPYDIVINFSEEIDAASLYRIQILGLYPVETVKTGKSVILVRIPLTFGNGNDEYPDVSPDGKIFVLIGLVTAGISGQ